MAAPSRLYINPSAPLFSKGGREYIADKHMLDAANAALALGVPLLLTGEPGCGKTQFAWAVASALQRRDKQLGSGARDFDEPLECYIRSDTRARDLLYYYDSLRRFGDSQLGRENKAPLSADARNYIVLKPLGIALMSETLRVVLIDEIDKAPRDLPNDLLRELDQGEFEITEADREEAPKPQESDVVRCRNSRIPLWRTMRRPPGAPKPFIVITSNVERQLPDAFLRRCIFYHIPFPSDEQLSKILAKHAEHTPSIASIGPFAGTSRARQQPLPPTHAERVLREALIPHAKLVFQTLRDMKLTKLPATAELLNWVDSLLIYEDSWDSADTLAKVVAAIAGRNPGDLFHAACWKDVPALGCLVKLREDLERLIPPQRNQPELKTTG